MAGNLFGILLFGWGVEQQLGKRWYVCVLLLSTVVGVFALAIVHPMGSLPIAGGSLVGFTLFGMWLAIYYQTFWTQHLRVTLGVGSDRLRVHRLLAVASHHMLGARPD